jgi:hypothetical protein
MPVVSCPALGLHANPTREARGVHKPLSLIADAGGEVE